MAKQKAHVFVSYSRKDTEFSKRLVNALSRQDRDIWVDWEDIGGGEDWLQAIYEGIERADTFILITTYNSLTSEVCNLEIQHALQHNKRIIPIMRESRETVEQTLQESITGEWDTSEWGQTAYKNWEAVSHLNWIFFDDDALFDAHLQTLIDVVDTDLNHVKSHTRLLVRAREWEQNAQSKGFLASGDELTSAEGWLNAADNYKKQPSATALHRNYIRTSREEEDAANARLQRLQSTTRFAAIAIGLLVIAALAAGIISLNAVNRTNIASTDVANANLAVDDANAQVTEAEENIVIASTNEAIANNRVEAAETRLSAAEAQVTAVNETLAPIPETLTPVAVTLTQGAQNQATAASQLEFANTEVVQANNDVLTAIVQLVTADAEFSEAQNQIDIANLQVTDAQQQIATVGVQVTAAQDQLATAAAQVTQAQGDVALAAVEVTAAQIDIATAAAQVTQAQGEVAAAALEVTVVQAQIVTANADVTQAQGQVATAAIQVTTAQEQVDAANADLQVANATLSPIAPTLTQAANSIIAVSTEAEEGRVAVAEANNALTQVAPTLTQAGDTVLAASTQVAEAETQVADVEAEVAVASTDRAAIQLTAEISRVQAASQSLIFRAEQAIETGDVDLALPLLLRSYEINANLAQTQRLLNDIAYTTARYIVDDSPFVVISPDSRHMVYTDGSALIVQDIQAREIVTRLDEHTDQITVADFSPNGQLLLTGSVDTNIIVWDTATWEPVATLSDHTTPIVDAEFDANTTRVVSVAGDDAAIVWQVNLSYQPTYFLTTPGTALNRANFVGDGSRFLAWGVVGQDSVIVTGNTGNGQFNRRLDNIYQTLNPGFDGDAVRYAMTDEDNELVIYDVINASPIGFTIDTTRLQVGARALNSIGNAAVVAFTNTETAQTELTIYDVATRARRPDLRFEGSETMRITALAFSPDGQTILGADGRYLIMWNAETGRRLRRLAGHRDDIIDITLSPDGQHAITTSRDGNRRVWDVDPSDPSVITQVSTTSIYDEPITSPGLSPDGSQVYFTIGFEVHRMQVDGNERLAPPIPYFDLSFAFFSESLPLVITIAENRNAFEMFDVTDLDDRLWDTVLGAPAGASIESIGTFSEDSTLAAVVMTDFIRVYDVSRRVTPSDAIRLDRAGLDISAVVFSVDNTMLYATVNAIDGVESYAVASWDLATLARTVTPLPHVNRINAVDIDDAGERLITASSDDTIVLFDLATGQISRRLSGHQAPVNAVYFTREDTVALSASDDGTLILWNLALGEPIREYIAEGAVTGLALSQDGRVAASTNQTDAVTIWEIQTVDEIATWIRANRTVPVLTEAQCGQFEFACDDG